MKDCDRAEYKPLGRPLGYQIVKCEAIDLGSNFLIIFSSWKITKKLRSRKFLFIA